MDSTVNEIKVVLEIFCSSFNTNVEAPFYLSRAPQAAFIITMQTTNLLELKYCCFKVSNPMKPTKESIKRWPGKEIQNLKSKE